MTRDDKKAKRTVAARSEFARRPPEGTTPIGTPPAAPFFVAGGVVAAIALAILGWFLVVSYGGGSLEELVPTLASDFPPVALPISVFIFAGCALFLAEMFRRAAWYSRTEWKFSRGNTSLQIRPLSLAVRVLWMLVAIAFYLVLIPLPVLVAQPKPEPSEDFWMLVTAHGFIAAGFVGIFLVALVKHASYRRESVTSSSGSPFWRVASVQWRVESWLGFLAGGLGGILPLATVAGGNDRVSVESVPVVALISIGCGVLACLAAVATPRSGAVEGDAESVV